MKKSPLNVNFADITQAIGTGNKGYNKKVKVSQRMVDQIRTLWSERPKPGDDGTAPSFQTGVQGDLAENMIQTAPEAPIAPPSSFDPGASVAAENMFGAELPGSFDRSMGG
tara:strand:+ start:112 stop:444 length:333 start_codon:yes stop_codon:yes gene_type:complete